MTDEHRSEKWHWLVLLILPLLTACAGRTARIDAPNAVASIEKIELGGVKQWILIRGADQSNPVLLFVHGGPGSPEMPLNHAYGTGLEQNFVLVHWDQRGAGKSYHASTPAATMNVEQFISDCHELTQWLKTKFGREKIYLLGHSWGSLLGTLTVARYPGDYIAYIGIGQVVELTRNESISYRFVREEADKRGDKKGARELDRIGPPPYDNIMELAVERSYLQKYGGATYKEPDDGLVQTVLRSPEYTAWDRLKYLAGTYYSIDRMWDEVLTYNLFEQVPRLEVPVYFMEGRHDYNTPWELVEEYYEQLDAPAGKSLIWFEDSAHSPNLEEPERFAEVMRTRVLAETGLTNNP